MRRTGRILGALLVAAAANGCMFKVKHELPARSYFGHLPKSEQERTRPFETHGMKNWALAGMVAYSGWGTKDLIPGAPAVRRVEDLAVETRFSTIDTIVWVIPGFAYGYYLWAPRTIEVEGNRVYEKESHRR
jgi:hypothetical protein